MRSDVRHIVLAVAAVPIHRVASSFGADANEAKLTDNRNLRNYKSYPESDSNSGRSNIDSTSSTDSECYSCDNDDPCPHGGGYYRHCDSDMFVQCDDHGGCQDMPCPPGTTWSQEDLTCVHDRNKRSNSEPYPAPSSRKSRNIEDDSNSEDDSKSNNKSESDSNSGRSKNASASSTSSECHSCGYDNPCSHGEGYYRHCDSDMFVQCDDHGGCHDMSCASGTVWNQDVKACVHECNPYPCNNPCTADNIDHENFYHSYCKADDKFIQCDAFGGCFVMPCAPGTVWSQEHQTCVHDCDTGYCGNPCTAENVEDGNFYHEHCTEDDKFIQCDDRGGCFVMPCASGTVWSQKHQVCVHECNPSCDNPCTDDNIEDGHFYHEHCKKDDQFIQCDDFGGCFTRDCADGTVWSQEDLTCVHDRNKRSNSEPYPAPSSSKSRNSEDDSKSKSKSTSEQECNPYPCDNPCTDDNIERGYFYHEHCQKDDKFIQCDNFGGCFTMDCPDGTGWSQKDLVCVDGDNSGSHSKSKSNNGRSHSNSKSESESEPYHAPRYSKSKGKGKGQGDPKSKGRSSIYHSSDDYYSSASKGKSKGGTKSKKSGSKSGGKGKGGYSDDRSGVRSRPRSESRSKGKGGRKGSWSKSSKRI